MQLSVEARNRTRAPHFRFSEIESGLGIAGNQQAAWDVFVETFVTVWDMLGDVEQQGESKLLDRAPSLPDLLRVQRVRLAAQLESTRLLTAITENLYRSLNDRQRIRADRLLLPLCNELGLGKAALHRLSH